MIGRGGDTPRLRGSDDALDVKAVAHPFNFRKYQGEAELTERIVEAINRMGGAGSEAEDAYRSCVDRLRRKQKAAINVIEAEYRDMADDAYLDRWSLVMLLVELQDERSLQFFDELLGSPIPEEKSADPHGFSTVGEEVMLRTTAVEGLERMAADGSERAIEVLLKHAGHEVFSIRRAIAQALVEVGGEDMRKTLEEKLSPRHRDVLNIRRTDVRKVEQAEGGLFVKTRDDAATPPPNESDNRSPGGGKGDGGGGGGGKRGGGDGRKDGCC